MEPWQERGLLIDLEGSWSLRAQLYPSSAVTGVMKLIGHKEGDMPVESSPWCKETRVASNWGVI